MQPPGLPGFRPPFQQAAPGASVVPNFAALAQAQAQALQGLGQATGALLPAGSAGVGGVGSAAAAAAAATSVLQAQLLQQNATLTAALAAAARTGGAAPQAAAAVLAAEAAPANKSNKKRKLPERHIPEKVQHIIPESIAFNKLLEQQRRLDDFIQHRRSEIQESLGMPEHTKKRIRLYLFNQHAHQKPPSASSSAPDTSTSGGPAPEPPSWVFCIHGRVLDGPIGSPEPGPKPAGAAGAAAMAGTSAGLNGNGAAGSGLGPHGPQGKPMSHYIRRLEIRLDPAQYPGAAGTIVWEKAAHAHQPHRDCFEVRRTGSHNVDVQVSLEVDYQPERYSLPPGLSQLLGLQYETRPRVLSALWTYIKEHDLQDKALPHVINLNDELEQVFQVRSLKVCQVFERLAPLLAPMPPITLEYTIRVDGPSPQPPACYELELDVPAAPGGHSNRVAAILDRCSKDREIEELDAKMTKLIRHLNEHRRRRAFFLGFSQSPVDFIYSFIASQARDLRVAKTGQGQAYELERRSEVFRQKWVDDAVLKYLQKKTGSGH